MESRVVLLRGVNVNGITVRNAALREVLTDAGYRGVRCVLASGNVVLDDPDEPLPVTTERVEQLLRNAFGYDAWVVVLTATRLARLAADYPFPRDDDTDHPYLVLAADPDRVTALLDGAPVGDREAVAAGDGVAYWRVPRGSSTDTPFARHCAAARWKLHVTTRNLRTVEKVLVVANG